MVRKISIKFIIGLLLIFSLSFIVLNQTVKGYIESSNRNLVSSELNGFKNNSNVYIRQAFLINHFTSNEMYFGEIAPEIARDLTHTTNSSVGIYTIQGKLLYTSDSSVFSQDQQKESDIHQILY